MNCTGCGYALWGIRERLCPECGKPFKPSDFDLVVNSVSFCCPVCDQAYYGTGERGRLVPSSFVCVSCGEALDMDAMVLRPAPGIAEQRTAAYENPWVDRRTRSWLGSWLSTLGRGIARPVAVVAATPPDSDLNKALGFATLTNTAFAITGGLPILFFMMLGAGTGLGIGVLGAIVVALVIVPLAGWSGLFIWSAAAHGLLRLTGPTPHGLRRTAHALCYTCGPNFLSAIPCFGFYISWIGAIWWVAAAATSLAAAQRVPAWRAVLATAGPILLAVALTIGGFALHISRTLPSARTVWNPGPAATPPGPAQAAQATRIARALVTYAGAGSGWPDHAARLVAETVISDRDFTGRFTGWSFTSPDQVAIGPVALSDLAFSHQADAAIRAAAAAAGDGPAYRVGDMVICVRCGDRTDLPSDAWLVMSWPDPALNTAPLTGPCIVGRVDGEREMIPVAAFDAALAAQNRLRAGLGLPPLPHPRDVRSTPPAPAPDVQSPDAAPSAPTVAPGPS